ncbi:hypothetical protein EVAR_83172_1 [Eumeta japonica]|uniref:Uncharacterized protein n=1 Tax=Eumeta variegata TaxID=151549 RepID=A0A4C1YCU2_EUMVA|nr:hypothetical protein EVAR_83172_1 [Eumeta japonica]
MRPLPVLTHMSFKASTQLAACYSRQRIAIQPRMRPSARGQRPDVRQMSFVVVEFAEVTLLRPQNFLVKLYPDNQQPASLQAEFEFLTCSSTLPGAWAMSG